MTFQVPPGAVVRNPNIRIEEVRIESIPFDLTWLPDLINSVKSEILSELNSTEGRILKLIEDKVKELKEHFDTTLQEEIEQILSQDLVRQIGNELVGETYHRWDTRVRYYPSLVFIFLEPEYEFLSRQLQTTGISQKKTQIKIRIEQLGFLNNDETEIQDWVSQFQENLLTYKELNYRVGNFKCNYVHSGHVTWKTALSCTSKEEGHFILSSLCSLLKINYDPGQLSVTLLRESQFESEPIQVVLFKVVLLINGQPTPYVIYHA